MNNNFISILSDTTMKYLMKEERTRNIYLELFSHIIGIDLSNYKIIDNELNSGNKRKDYRLDLLLEEGDIIVNVEINSVRSRKNERKNNMYICHLVLRQTKNAEDYSKRFKKVCQINLNTYSVTNDDRFVVRSRLLDDKTYEEIHSFFEIYDVNLAKILFLLVAHILLNVSLNAFECLPY